MPVGLTILNDWQADLSEQLAALNIQINRILEFVADIREGDPRFLTDVRIEKIIMKTVVRTVNDWENLYDFALTYEFDPVVREEIERTRATEACETRTAVEIPTAPQPEAEGTQ